MTVQNDRQMVFDALMKAVDDVGILDCEDIKAVFENLPSADVKPAVRCKNCKHSTEWYRDKRRCFLWCEDGIDVFEDGYCNYWDQKGGEQNG